MAIQPSLLRSRHASGLRERGQHLPPHFKFRLAILMEQLLHWSNEKDLITTQ